MSRLTLSDGDVAAIKAVLDVASTPQRGGPEVVSELLLAIDRLVPCDELDLVGTDGRILGHYLDLGLVGGRARPGRARHSPVHLDGEGPFHGFWSHFWEDPCSLPERTGDYTSVSLLSDFFSDRQLRAHRMYAENLYPRGLLREVLVTWPEGQGRTIRLLCWRGPSSDFTERERLILRLLRPHLAAALTEDAATGPGGQLSPRQTEVLRLMALGFTNAQIASRLALSEGTVRTHVNRIFERLGATSRTDAVMLALQHGLMQPPDVHPGP